MRITFNKNIFLTILLSIVFVCASGEQQPKTDKMCPIIPNVLCVKHVLNSILRIAENISQTANAIEKRIFHEMEIHENLQRSVNDLTALVSENLPKHQYYDEFLKRSNIDQKFLADLFSETLYAMSFCYNSIEDLVKIGDIFAVTTDAMFEQIASNLRNGIICPYRSILNVYSYEWPVISEVDRIQFSRNKHGNSPSTVHQVHSIIIAQLLRKWAERIESVIINLDPKYA